MRYAIVARERARYSVRQLCRTLEVSVSGFHEYLSRLKRPDPDAALQLIPKANVMLPTLVLRFTCAGPSGAFEQGWAVMRRLPRATASLHRSHAVRRT